MVKRTRSRVPLLSMNMKKGDYKCQIFNPFTKHLKCHSFINYLTLSTIHRHGKYFYCVIYVTVNVSNQSFGQMPLTASHLAKCLKFPVIWPND